LILIGTPSCAPVNKPNEVHNPSSDEEVKKTRLLGLDNRTIYIRMLVVPQKVGEGEEGKVVVSSLKASKASDGDDGKKQLFNVLDHCCD
jgi:uncharacterized protein YrzB (UPF0473 family)